jgi:hypothetical protein
MEADSGFVVLVMLPHPRLTFLTNAQLVDVYYEVTASRENSDVDLIPVKLQFQVG